MDKNIFLMCIALNKKVQGFSILFSLVIRNFKNHKYKTISHLISKIITKNLKFLITEH